MKNNKAFFDNMKNPEWAQKMQKDIAKKCVGNDTKRFSYVYKNNFNDPRVQVMNASWFANKRVLDIGCNQGITDMILAMKF